MTCAIQVCGKLMKKIAGPYHSFPTRIRSRLVRLVNPAVALAMAAVASSCCCCCHRRQSSPSPGAVADSISFGLGLGRAAVFRSVREPRKNKNRGSSVSTQTALNWADVGRRPARVSEGCRRRSGRWACVRLWAGPVRKGQCPRKIKGDAFAAIH